MKWTSEKPTEPGWWWCLPDGGPPEVVKCFIGHLTGTLWAEIYGTTVRVDALEGQWSGPIKEPEE